MRTHTLYCKTKLKTVRRNQNRSETSGAAVVDVVVVVEIIDVFFQGPLFFSYLSSKDRLESERKKRSVSE